MWSSECIETDGDRYFAALIADIDAAAVSVDLESYIVEDDEIAGSVLAALTRAHERGVAVRLLVDGVGAAGWIMAKGRGWRCCPWRIYHPMPWTVVGTYLPTSSWLESRLQFLRLLNRRNHRKTCVIDGRIAWIGSQNLERRHSRQAFGDGAWRDTAARVEGDAVAVITTAFNDTWRRSWRFGARHLRPSIPFRPLRGKVDRSGPVRLSGNRRLRRGQWKDLVARMAAARTRLWITTPYFVPTEDLLRALERAAATADVRLLLPRINDIRFMPWVAALYTGRLQRAGVRLFAYPRMVHAKTQVIDDQGLVGSSNLNSRSLLFDLEADVWLVRPESVQALAEAFTADCTLATEVPTGQGVGWRERILGNLTLLARRWI